MSNGENAQTHIISKLSFPLYQCKGWMKLVGVMSIIGGVLQILTIFGIIAAWLPIWTGILLFQSANATAEAYETENQGALLRSLSRLKTYFIIMGVLTLIGIIICVLFLFGILGPGLLFWTRSA